MNYLVVIPARMASSRLPGKPLVDLKGKSLIQRTYEQCLQAVPSDNVVVATDDARIKEHCHERNMNVIMTSVDCLTGTDRVAEAARQIEADCYINVQGDEPVIDPNDIKTVIDKAKENPELIINGYAPIINEEMWKSLSTPKVVVSEEEDLIYMSRAPIPGNKSGKFKKAWRQVCIYSFPKEALRQFSRRDKKGELEEIEDIEILRFLEMGLKVRMVKLSDTSIAVDHPEDVEKVIERLKYT